MNLKNIMSKNIISCDVSSTIYDIALLMKKNDIGFVPITKNNMIIGTITDRDIVTKVISNKDELIDGYYTNKLITVNVNNDINEVLNLMGKHKIKRILVEDKEIVGIISLSDIIRFFDDKLLVNTIKKIFMINRNVLNTNTSINSFEL